MRDHPFLKQAGDATPGRGMTELRTNVFLSRPLWTACGKFTYNFIRILLFSFCRLATKPFLCSLLDYHLFDETVKKALTDRIYQPHGT